MSEQVEKVGCFDTSGAGTSQQGAHYWKIEDQWIVAEDTRLASEFAYRLLKTC